MKLKVINMDGKRSNDIEISDKIFSLTPDKYVIQLLIDWQLNRFKPRTAKTKQRSEIKGSTAKIYAQKGTGGARHSSRKAPIFVGGGVAHGPKGAVYKIKKINKKVRKFGLFYLLSQKNKVNSLFVVEDFKYEIKKTKLFNKFLEKRGKGVHHIAFLVDNLSLALDELSGAGVQLIDRAPRVGAEGMLIAFLHPSSTSGVLVELCQKP